MAGLTAVLLLGGCLSSRPQTTTGSVDSSSGGTPAGAASSTEGSASGSNAGSTSTTLSTTGGSNSAATSTTGTSSSSSGGLPLAELISDVVQFECGALVQCGVEAAYVAASCPAQLAAQLSPIAKDIDAGLVTYSPTAAPACLAQLLDAGCALFNSALPTCSILFTGDASGSGNCYDTTAPACAAVFAGTVPVSGTCYDTNECLHGFCNSGGTCAGACASYAQSGESCVGVSCDTMLTCNPSHIDGPVCYPSNSLVDAGVGGSCDPGWPSCDFGTQCWTNGLCVADIPDGGACATANASLCTTGTACTGAAVGAIGYCLPRGDTGTICEVSIGCLQGLVCVAGPDGGWGTCTQPPATGPCLSNTCAWGTAFCSPATNTCLPVQPTGGACDPTLAGVDCIGGTCASLADGGECGGPCSPP